MTVHYLEDFAVGQTYVSPLLRVDEARAVDFAKEFDPQPFHLDDKAAREYLWRARSQRLAHRGDDHAAAGRGRS